MKKITWFKFPLFCLFLLGSCISFKYNSFNKELIQTGSGNEAIHNAILDFSHIGKLYIKDSVFSVSFLDTLYRKVLIKSNDGYKWINGEINEGTIAVSIIASYNKFLLTAETKAGGRGKLPSRYVEKDGKLFFWWDNNYPLTEETLAVFNKYHLLQDDEGGKIKFPEFEIDDSRKGVDYYFCRNNLTKYKKVIASKAIGYYEPPKLGCEP